MKDTFVIIYIISIEEEKLKSISYAFTCLKMRFIRSLSVVCLTNVDLYAN